VKNTEGVKSARFYPPQYFELLERLNKPLFKIIIF
jgi:hypothetical protein